MAKSKVENPADRALARASGIRQQRGPSAKDIQPRKSPASRSAAMRLAAELDRLQAELAAAHGKVAELEAKVDIDPLLDLLNRRGFERELRRSLAYVRRYGAAAALVYLDLDDFKPVNDRYGHAAGDRVLQAVAQTLLSAVRESDVVARLGGDEFGVLLWNVNESQAASKAQELEAAIGATSVSHGKALVMVGASAGTTTLQPVDAPTEVIERADLAMYARKRARHAVPQARFATGVKPE